MAEAGAWPSIREHGLLSTSALLDLYGYEGEERFAIESQRRAQIVRLTRAATGETALVRDNKPLRLDNLEACLIDMTSREWCDLLNRKVFFWVSAKRLNTLLRARAYKSRPHDVLTIDAQALIERDLDRLALAPINTGATIYPTATRRGSQTFLPIADYPLDEYIRWRGKEDAIVELAAEYAVYDVQSVTLRVERRFRDQIMEVLWDGSP